jgi:hypothetical protein
MPSATRSGERCSASAGARARLCQARPACTGTSLVLLTPLLLADPAPADSGHFPVSVHCAESVLVCLPEAIPADWVKAGLRSRTGNSTCFRADEEGRGRSPHRPVAQHHLSGGPNEPPGMDTRAIAQVVEPGSATAEYLCWRPPSLAWMLSTCAADRRTACRYAALQRKDGSFLAATRTVHIVWTTATLKPASIHIGPGVPSPQGSCLGIADPAPELGELVKCWWGCRSRTRRHPDPGHWWWMCEVFSHPLSCAL